MLLIALVVIHLNTEQSQIAQPEGIILAVTSGAIMSGLGYAIWYAVLPYLSASMAAVLQLLVPIIATIGGVFFANESITLHLVIATLSVLGGVLLVIIARKRTPKNA